MRKISMSLSEYNEDLEKAKQAGHAEYREEVDPLWENQLSDAVREREEKILSEIFSAIGCKENGSKWDIDGTPEQILERLQALHKRKFPDLSDIPF